MSVIRTAGGYSVTLRPRAVLAGTACAAVALAVGVLAIGSGEYPMAPGDVVRTLVGQGDAADAFIVQELRLPRLVTALAVGVALALAGAVFQAVVRNPLGSPDVLGFTHGSATGALTAIVIGGGSAALAGGALIGGVVTGVAVYGLAWRGGIHGYRLVLVGIGVAAMLTGVNGYLLTKAQITEAGRAVLWMTGSLDGRGWGNAAPLLAALAVLVPLVLLGCERGLRMMEMGDDAASALGVRVERVRLTLLASAVLLVSADFAAQRAFGGQELPVGVVTGVLGGGYLVWLLATERRAGRI